jgi:hypothetical protein
MSQSCGSCKRFRPIEPDHFGGYCTWHWAHVAIDDARDDREHWTEETLGATCDCYDEKETTDANTTD